LPWKVEPQHSLRQVEGVGVVSERFQILLGLAVFDLAHLSLREPEPPSQQFLVESLAEQLKMPGVIAVRPENLADVLALERRTKLAGLEETVAQVRRWCAELIALLPVTSTAQACRVVRSEH
jgi:hypothetical protein